MTPARTCYSLDVPCAESRGGLGKPRASAASSPALITLRSSRFLGTVTAPLDRSSARADRAASTANAKRSWSSSFGCVGSTTSQKLQARTLGREHEA